jgi:sulfatase modifying factor 1
MARVLVVPLLVGAIFGPCRPGPNPAPPVTPPAARRPLSDAVCAAAAPSLEPSLAGLEPAGRAAFAEAAGRGVVVVRYVAEACAPRLELQPDCRPPLRYTLHPPVVAGPVRRAVRSAGALWGELPFLVAREREAWLGGRSWRLSEHPAGRWALAAGEGVTRRALEGKGCGAATHVVTAVELGALAVEAAPDEQLEALDGSDRAGVIDVDRDGRPEACADPAALRPEGCRAAIRLRLAPIAPPELGPVAARATVPAGPARIGPGPESASLSAFEIDRVEVSAGRYAECVAAKRCPAPGEGPFCTGDVVGAERLPINCVRWSDAADYCAFAGGRLPTEAEWERAARGAAGQVHPWGPSAEPPAGAANLAGDELAATRPHWARRPGWSDAHPGLAPVDVLGGGASPEGALHMAGNVAEWVADWYAEATPRGRDPKGPSRGRSRVVKGSSFGDADGLEASRRDHYLPDVRSQHIGFRCAR